MDAQTASQDPRQLIDAGTWIYLHRDAHARAISTAAKLSTPDLQEWQNELTAALAVEGRRMTRLNARLTGNLLGATDELHARTRAAITALLAEVEGGEL